MGIAEVNINGKQTTIMAHSGINDLEVYDRLDPSIKDYFVLSPENPTFNPIVINGDGIIDGSGAFLRDRDSEYKIFEELARQLGDDWNASGVINIFTERNPCRSCSGVMDQFQDRYPNIRIEVSYDKDRYNT